MPKFLSYGSPIVMRRTIEILGEDGSPFFIYAKRTGDKIIVEEISDSLGHVRTAADLVKETRMTPAMIRDRILQPFKGHD